MLRLCWALLVLGHHASADIYVTKEDDTTEYILDSEPSDFGPMMPLRGMAGYLLPGVPEDGCSPLEVLPPANATETDFFVILRRADNCTPTQQVLMSQRAGFSCVIVHNVGSNDIDPMDGDDDVRIPSVFIGETNGILLRTNFLLGSGYYLLLTGNYSFTFFAFLVPTILLCMGCVFLLCCMQLFRCVSDRRRARRKLLPQKVLQAIPTKSFQPGVHKWETCAICLEDYVEKDLVRILPCRHAFHSVCVDPWLTCTKRVCPICKRRVISATMSASCWDTDDENIERLPESERRPLLRTRDRRGYGAAPTTGGTTAEPEPARPAPVAAPSPRPRSMLTEVQVHNFPEVPPQAVVVNPQRRRRRRRRGDGYQRLPERSPPRQPPQTDDAAASVTASSTTNTAVAPSEAAAASVVAVAAPVAAEAAPVAVVVAAPAAAASASTEASGDHTDLV